MIPGISSVVSKNTTPLTLEFLGYLTQNVNGPTKTWSGRSLGAANSTRRIVLVITNAGDSNARTVTSTIAGVSGTEIAHSGGTFTFSTIHIAHVPTGTTGDITVTFSNNTVNQIAVGVYRVIGMSSNNAFDNYGVSDTPAPSISFTLDIPFGGVVIAGARSTANVTVTWTNLTEDYDITLSNSATQLHTGSSNSFSQTQNDYNISIRPSSGTTTIRLCAVSLGP